MGGGGVIRRDSGWQASSPAFSSSQRARPASPTTLYTPASCVACSPSAISARQAYRADHLHGQEWRRGPGTKFFDARVRIDGLQGEISAEGVLGFLQIKPWGKPLHRDDLRHLLQQQGPAGGPVDGTVQVGNSGFRVRATRIEVDTTVGPGGEPELVGVVRSAPIFHQDGSWSAVRLPGPGNSQPNGEAVNASGVRGLPIVREGILTSVIGDDMKIQAQGDHLFADAADLHQRDNPLYEYGFLQTSPAKYPSYSHDHMSMSLRASTSCAPDHRHASPTSSRCTTKGAGPPAANSITLPADLLIVDPATGGFRLPQPISLSAPRTPLILATNGVESMRVDYQATPATLSLTLDESRWHLSRFSLASRCGSTSTA